MLTINCAKNILRIRSDLNLSQQELAERSSIDHSTLSHIESGTTSPSLDLVENLASALGVSAINLVCHKEEV
jgi:transcriptional regulator with XRE-family HTH domain